MARPGLRRLAGIVAALVLAAAVSTHWAGLAQDAAWADAAQPPEAGGPTLSLGSVLLHDTRWGDGVQALNWSPDGTRLAVSWVAARQCEVWELPGGDLLHELPVDIAFCRGPAFTSNGRYVVTPPAITPTAETPVAATAWDAETGRPARHLRASKELAPANLDGESIVVDRSGRFIAVGHRDRKTISIFDGGSFALIGTLPPLPPKAIWASMAISPDGSLLAAGDYGGTVHLYALPGRTELRAWTRLLPGPATALAFSPDGTLLASGGRTGRSSWPADDGRIVTTVFDPTVQTWDVETGAEVARLGVSTGAVYGLSFSPDGAFLAIASQHALQIRRVRDGREVARLDAEAYGGVAFSPDGSRIAVGGAALDVIQLETSH